jgi:hypothetical protein
MKKKILGLISVLTLAAAAYALKPASFDGPPRPTCAPGEVCGN